METMFFLNVMFRKRCCYPFATLKSWCICIFMCNIHSVFFLCMCDWLEAIVFYYKHNVLTPVIFSPLFFQFYCFFFLISTCLYEFTMLLCIKFGLYNLFQKSVTPFPTLCRVMDKLIFSPVLFIEK